MEARNDRRAHDVPRIPLDVLVRLTHEDFDEPFDADGVDVSAGGLALRADYLPEVGDRLRCRFDCPPEGEEVELDGEVVWAHDAGERSGEFGLRFAELDVRAESALSRLVEHLGGAKRDGMRPRARLHLEGIATPIDGEVLERDGSWLTVEQELPFLRIGMSVAVEGTGPAQGRLSSVDLRVEQGVPRLVLVVEDARARTEGAIDAASEAPDDARSGAFDDAMDASAAAPSVESDATLQDFVAPDAASDALDDELDEVVRAIEREPRAAREEHARSEANDAMPAASTSPLDRIGPAWARARASAIELGQKARPALAALWTKLALLFAKGLEKGGPRAKGAWLRAKTIATELAAKAASRVTRGKGKRRTTSAPPVRVAQAPKLRRQREEQQPAPAPKKSRRVIALSALAFAGVGATVYAFSGEDPAPAPAPVAITAPPVAPAPAPLEPAPAALDPEQGATALPAEAAPLADPRAMPEPESEAGRLGEPTFPSLQQAARPAQPAQQPAQQEIISGGTSFGAAEVPNARPHTIRMSQPVASIRGEAQPDGFTVTVPGALALDRAAPIQAANPSIDQAMILNRGDHSVLTVRFVAGRNPAYRVVARGSAIEVSIGR